MMRALPALFLASDRASALACCANRLGNTWLLNQHASGPLQQTRSHSGSSASSNASSSSSAKAAQQEQATALTGSPDAGGSAGQPPAETLAGAAAGPQQRVFVNPELLAHISSTINRLTGYAGIEHLKAGVGATDSALQDSKRQMQAAKAEYEAQLAKQSQLHREVTGLLQRKSSWVAADVARFTELYAAEHATEAAVDTAKARYSRLSDDVEQLQLTLMDLIRERYQQEQLWSDKIRRASTWWTWGLMGLHFASFVLVYSVLEPRKRQALQDAVAGMLQAQAADLDIRLAPLALAVTAATAAAELREGNGNGGSDGGGLHLAAAVEQGAAAGRLEQRQAAGSCGVAVSRRERRQQQQPQQLSHDLEQTVLQELQRVQQQLQQLQQSLPGVAAAAASGAAADVQAQQQRRPWHIPGSGWATQQLAAAGASAKAAWQRGRDGVQQALLVRQASQAGHSSGADDAAAADDAAQAFPDSAEPAAAGGEQPEAVAAAGSGGPVAGSLPKALLQQLEAGDGVLEVSRGQLAALAGSAFAAGAGAAAVVLLLLSGSKG